MAADAAFSAPTWADGGDRVRIKRDGAVAIVRLSRPEKHNALDLRMFEAIVAAQAAIAADTAVRAVMLCGEGNSFCAGLDLDATDELKAGPPRALFGYRDGAGANLFQRAAIGWRDLAIPVVAALHGSVFGGGLQVAMGADIRIAAPESRLSIMETRWGLVPDMGGTVLFQGLVRSDHLRELIYGAAILTAAEAAEVGLITHVNEDAQGWALTLARTFAAASPRALAAAKRLLNAMPFTFEPGLLAAETAEQLPLLDGPDQREALAAYATRRPPCFDDSGVSEPPEPATTSHENNS